MDVKGYDHREKLHYHSEFTWIKVEDGVAIVGLNDFYCKLAGEISYIDMPSEGDDVSKDERIGTVETGKWVGKLIAPVTGEITEINEDVDDDPSIVNEDPYENWIMKIKMENPDEIEELMFGDKAVEWLEVEIEKHKQD